MEWILQNKEWIFSGIGIPLVTVICTFLIYTINKWRLRDKNNDLRFKLAGKYFAYHIRTNEDGLIICGVLKIRRSLSVCLRSGDCKYNGFVEYRGSNLFFNLAEKGGGELKSYVMNAPFKNDFEVIEGIFACLTHRAQPVSGKKLLVRCKKWSIPNPAILTESEVDERIIYFLKDLEAQHHIKVSKLITSKISDIRPRIKKS